jgi:hypothetical protein
MVTQGKHIGNTTEQGPCNALFPGFLWACSWFYGGLRVALRGAIREASKGQTLASLEFTGAQLKQALQLAQEYK